MATRKPGKTARKTEKSKDLRTEFIARGVLLRGSRILLCRNAKRGYFYLPGGHIEFAESAAQALEREFLEETGKRAAAASLVLVCEAAFDGPKRPHHEVNLVFMLEPRFPDKTVIRSREPGIGFEWVDLAAIPDLDVRPHSVKAWIASQSGPPSPTGAEFISEFPAR